MRQANQMSPAMRFFFSKVFPLPFVLVGLVTLYFGGRGIYRAKEESYKII